MIKRLPTIPEYYKKHIDSTVDLNEQPKQCCPFHKEDTPSWSYSRELNRWRCFGSCGVGGDVIELHRVNFKLRTRQEAEASLVQLFNLAITSVESLQEDMILVDEQRIKFDLAYNKCLMYANSVDRWLELDYVMSKYPIELAELNALLNKWTRNETVL